MVTALVISTHRAELIIEKGLKILRKHLALAVITGIITAIASVPAGAATYYVDAVNGDDSDPGTSTEPWKTISHAKSQADYGDTVYLRDGNYGNFTENRSTGGSTWLAYKADLNHSPVLGKVILGSSGSDTYVELEGLTITDGMGVYGRHINVQGCDIQGGDWSTPGIDGGPANGDGSSRYVVIENCDVHHAYRGIKTGGPFWVLRNNRVYTIVEDGIKCGASDTLIERNEIWDIDRNYGGCSGCHSDGMQIYSTTPQSNISIIGNIIRSSVVNGGGAIFLQAQGGPWTNLRVENNLVYDIDGNYLLIGGYDLYFNNNTIIESVPGVNMRVYDVKEMHNNVLSYVWTNGNVVSHGNNIFNNSPDGFTRDISSVILSQNDFMALFEDYDARDFNLADSSNPSAINFGNPDYGPDTDILGNSRDAQPDAGCYEYVSGPPDTTAPSKPQNFIATAVSESQIDLNWDASTDPESGISHYNVYRNGSKIAEEDTTSYSSTGLSSATSYSYYITAVNNQGLESEQSDTAQATTQSDTTAPAIESVSALQSSVVIVFSETLDSASAENSSNYSIDNGISVISASLNTDTVTLTTSAHEEDTYELTVQNIKDTSENEMSLTTVDYDYTSGLIGFWHLNDGSGTSAQDSSGQNNDGVLTNGPTWTTGIDSDAVHFDGDNDAVQVPTAGLNTDGGTILLWGYIEDITGVQYLYGHTVGTWSNRIQLYLDDGSLCLGLGDSHTTDTGIYQMTHDTWYHVALVWDGSNYIVYVNGTARANGSYSGLDSLSSYADLGNTGNESLRAEAVDGIIDEVKIYNRSLNASEVQAIYNDYSSIASTYTLNITAYNGSVSKDPDKDRYDSGETVTLQATPDSGYYFTGWSGDASGTNTTVDITMNGNKSVVAGFGQDTAAPTLTGLSPEDDQTQVPLNNLIQMHLVDNGSGIDADSVNITLNSDVIYTGDTAGYESATGTCYRLGSNNDYVFVYQADELFDFDRQMQLAVSASDNIGNDMSQSWSFSTQMRSFGANKSIADESSLDRQITATACDGNGNIWVAWHHGQPGSRNIHLARLLDGEESFDNYINLTNDSYDQCNPDIAIDQNNKLYVVWQGDNAGNWDIYASTSDNWSVQRQVTSSDADQVNPAVAVNSSAYTYVVWEDDRNSNGDIYAAGSSDSFQSSTLWAVATEQSQQSEPAVAVDADDIVYLVWTDRRQGNDDIYIASSDDGPWTNYPFVSRSYSQSSPTIAAEDSGSKLHLLWTDDRSSDYDIYYAASDGIPASPVDGENIVDDTTNADQFSPAIVVAGSTGSDLEVFACWQDQRSSDSDIYFAQLGGDAGGTNIFVGDGDTNSEQAAPALGLDGHGYPYLVWTDDRNDNMDIFYAASTYMDPQPVAQEEVTAGSSAVVGPTQINSLDDVSVNIPTGACWHNVNVKISPMQNMPSFSQCIPVANYDVGPSGITFNDTVTIIIPYDAVVYPDVPSPYCYEPQQDSPSQNGISSIQWLELPSAPGIHAISFQTTHFSQFFLAAVPDDGEPDVLWRFGTYDDQKNAKVDITGNDGNPVLLSLRGDGYGEVLQEQDSVNLVLYDTTDRTSLIISAKDRSAGSSIGSIEVNGSLRQISAKGIDLEGDITVSGTLGKVIFDDVTGSIITIGPVSNPRAGLSLKLGRVTDSNITSQTPIKNLVVTDWRDTDSVADCITAPCIDSLKALGDRRNNLDGDFYADLVLATAASNPLKAAISGDLIDADWSIDGDIKSLVVKGAADNSYICCTGSILRVVLGASYDSDFLAGADIDFEESGPDQVSDFLTTSAQIKSFTVKGLKTQPDQYYFVNSNVSAPCIGRVKIVNLKTQNSGNDFGIVVVDTDAGNDLASVTNKSTIDDDDSFTVKQGDGIPGTVEDFCMEILEQ